MSSLMLCHTTFLELKKYDDRINILNKEELEIELSDLLKKIEVKNEKQQQLNQERNVLESLLKSINNHLKDRVNAAMYENLHNEVKKLTSDLADNTANVESINKSITEMTDLSEDKEAKLSMYINRHLNYAPLLDSFVERYNDSRNTGNTDDGKSMLISYVCKKLKAYTEILYNTINTSKINISEVYEIENILLKLSDIIRICVRNQKDADDINAEALLMTFLKLSEYVSPSAPEESKEKEEYQLINSVDEKLQLTLKNIVNAHFKLLEKVSLPTNNNNKMQEMALRCMINLIHQIPGLYQMMISKDDACVDRNGDNGIKRLTSMIKKKNNNDNNFVNNNFVIYGIRLIYMLVAKFNVDIMPVYERVVLILIKTLSNISSQFKASYKKDLVLQELQERFNLCNETCKLLYSIDIWSKKDNIDNKKISEKDYEYLQDIICKLLNQLHEYRDNDEAKNTTNHLIQVATLAAEKPQSNIGYKLYKANCTSTLNYVLSQQLLKAKSADNLQNKVVILTPILILATHASANQDFRDVLKTFIFPDKYYAELHDNDAKSESMAPKMFAPKDSLRGQLIELMTCLDSSIKRYASELLFILCNEDKNEFVNRTGFGNAIHMLQIKGIM